MSAGKTINYNNANGESTKAKVELLTALGYNLVKGASTNDELKAYKLGDLKSRVEKMKAKSAEEKKPETAATAAAAAGAAPKKAVDEDPGFVLDLSMWDKDVEDAGSVQTPADRGLTLLKGFASVCRKIVPADGSKKFSDLVESRIPKMAAGLRQLVHQLVIAGTEINHPNALAKAYSIRAIRTRESAAAREEGKEGPLLTPMDEFCELLLPGVKFLDEGNPVGQAAGVARVSHLKRQPGVEKVKGRKMMYLEEFGKKLCSIVPNLTMSKARFEHEDIDKHANDSSAHGICFEVKDDPASSTAHRVLAAAFFGKTNIRAVGAGSKEGKRFRFDVPIGVLIGCSLDAMARAISENKGKIPRGVSRDSEFESKAWAARGGTVDYVFNMRSGYIRICLVGASPLCRDMAIRTAMKPFLKRFTEGFNNDGRNIAVEYLSSIRTRLEDEEQEEKDDERRKRKLMEKYGKRYTALTKAQQEEDPEEDDE